MRNYLALFLLLFAASCQEKPVANTGRLPYYDTADFTPKWAMPAGQPFHQIRPFKLVNQQNQVFTERDLAGKICVADFFFTACPGICPRMTSSMGTIQQAFSNDDNVLLLSHSVMPRADSAGVLARYAQSHHVDFNRWKLLTGEKQEIYDLGRKYYFVEEDEGIKKGPEVFLHTENFVLLDTQRHLRGIYNGLDPNSMQDLIRDIKILEQE